MLNNSVLINLDQETDAPLPHMCPTCVSVEASHIDNGAVDRARAVARILARVGVWDGVSPIVVIDPYEVHDRLTQRWVKVDQQNRTLFVTAADAPVTSPIWGISPVDTDLDPQTQEIPDDSARTLTVRDFLTQIHEAASQAHYSRRSYEQTLLYIREKDQSAWSLKAEHRLKNSIYHIKAILSSAHVPSEIKLLRIRNSAAAALGLEVQS